MCIQTWWEKYIILYVTIQGDQYLDIVSDLPAHSKHLEIVKEQLHGTC